jgi:cytochrome subunit of sulfide dehydrogenase
MMKTSKVLLVLALTASSGSGGRAAEAPPGAAACSGCHASNAQTSGLVPSLAGRDAGEVASAMLQFKSGGQPATVMDRIAKGFSEEEIRAMAAWFAAQK